MLGAAFAQQFAPASVEAWEFVPARWKGPGLILSLFVHRNFFHLVGNLLFLAAVGPPLEFAVGKFKYGLVFLLGGLGGNLAHALLLGGIAPDSPLVGASGAVAALVAMASVRFHSVRVVLAPRVSVRALWMIVTWLALQVLGALLVIGQATGGTSHWAHLGGFFVGLALSLALRLPRADHIAFGHEVLDRINDLGPQAALVMAQRHLDDFPDDIRAKVTLAGAHRDLGHKSEEAEVLFSLLEAKDSDARVHAVLRLGELRMLDQIPSLQRCRMADEWRSTEPEAAEVLFRSVVSDLHDQQRPQALLDLLAMDPKRNASFAAVLERDYPLDPATEAARSRGFLP